MAIKVSLRRRPISKGRISLYLDFYPAIVNSEGKESRREYLRLYIIAKPKDGFQKESNKETIALAEQIRHRRENDLNKPEIYTEFEKQQLRLKEIGERDFVEYFKQLAHKRKSSNYDNWMSALHYLEDFTKGNLKFSELNEGKLNDFKHYLLTTKSRKSEKAKLSQNSAVSYFNKVKATLKQAFKDGLLQVDLNGRVESIKAEETLREFLTIEELNKLIKLECKDPLIKRAAIFSALTGLRFSDIEKLTWKEVVFTADQGYSLKFRQKKTGGFELLPIPDQAFELMEERKEPISKVFEGLKYSAYQNKHLTDWIKAAKIDKEITFHNFRHTFATLQLANGTDIYTVSKMLGHKNLSTTQIYTKVVDQAKRDTTNKIKLDFKGDEKL